MTDEHHPLSEDELRALAERRAAALKRVQELHQKNHHEMQNPKGGSRGTKQAPSAKGRIFRHQGR